jgi:hypothetical protein
VDVEVDVVSVRRRIEGFVDEATFAWRELVDPDGPATLGSFTGSTARAGSSSSSPARPSH